MMVKWANDSLLQANDVKMLVNDSEMIVNDGEMLVNDDEMSIWSYTHFTIIDQHLTIINDHFTIISLKLILIRSFDHHWEAAPTVWLNTNKDSVYMIENKLFVKIQLYNLQDIYCW